jgi:hypothetical protein
LARISSIDSSDFDGPRCVERGTKIGVALSIRGWATVGDESITNTLVWLSPAVDQEFQLLEAGGSIQSLTGTWEDGVTPFSFGGFDSLPCELSSQAVNPENQ